MRRVRRRTAGDRERHKVCSQHFRRPQVWVPVRALSRAAASAQPCLAKAQLTPQPWQKFWKIWKLSAALLPPLPHRLLINLPIKAKHVTVF